MCIPKRKYNNGDDLITIREDENTDICSICGAYFKHRVSYRLVKEHDGIKEVLFRTAHSGCLKIIARIKEKTQEITDLEYELYLKSNATINDYNLG